MMTSARLATYQRWARQEADVVSCPECGTAWTRNFQQRKDGTTRCSARCKVRGGNLARSAKAQARAIERYRGLVCAHPRLRVVSLQAAAIVELMLVARREGIAAGRLKPVEREV